MNQIVEALYARSICHLQYKSELPRIVVEDRMALSLNIKHTKSMRPSCMLFKTHVLNDN